MQAAITSRAANPKKREWLQQRCPDGKMNRDIANPERNPLAPFALTALLAVDIGFGARNRHRRFRAVRRYHKLLPS